MMLKRSVKDPANGVSEGTVSYSHVVRLLLQYYGSDSDVLLIFSTKFLKFL